MKRLGKEKPILLYGSFFSDYRLDPIRQAAGW